MDERDVVVVGAGPAGALAALEFARAGRSVLLVDKAHFPRAKVCGACIQPAALRTLTQAGLGDLVAAHGGVYLRQLALHAGGRTAMLDLPGGRAISRQAFDAALVRRAVAQGVEFRDGLRAHLGGIERDRRVVMLEGGGVVAASLVLAADGLGGGLLGDRGRVARRSYVGAGAVVEDAGSLVRAGTIHMTCGRDGYLGAVRVEGGALTIAAALAPAAARAKGLAGAARGLAPWLPDGVSWRGTPRLTRRVSRPFAERVLALGDAAGYVEPFTGEGIAWALASARAVAEVARDLWHPGLGRAWERTHRRLVRGRQWRCRLLTATLRAPRLVRAAVALLEHAPGLARPFVRGAALGVTP